MTIHVVCSGGMDSTTLLALALDQDGDDVDTISFNYGQRHARELSSAIRIAQHYQVPHRVIDLTGMLHGSVLLSRDKPVPEGHYAEDTMTATVVPGRNLLFAAAATAHAREEDEVWLGVHAGDHPVYPDCRPEFWEPLDGLVAAAYGVLVRTPFLYRSKAAIAKLGHQLGAPLELSWSCYQGRDRHCGRCGTCVERAEAFYLAEVPDPTVYADPDYWREATL